jgi:ATP-binding cassette subfamily B protein
MRDFKQHDVTDCGAACLAFVFYKHGLNISISALRQRSGTNTAGTTALGLVETAKEFDFEAKGVRCQMDDLKAIPMPGIAHVITDGGRQHYIVVCSVGKKKMKVMDPALGRIEKWPIEKFRAIWTNVFIILSPTINFKPSNEKKSSFSRLISLLGPQKHVLFQAFFGVILSTVLSLSTAIFIQKIVDNVIVDGNVNLLRLLGIAMIVILLIRTLLGYFQSVLMLRAAQRIDASLVLGYYRHLMQLPQSFFNTMRVGEITSRVGDAIAIRNFLNGTILEIIINPLILVTALVAMVCYSWKLALFTVVLVPANILIYLASDWLNKRYQREIMERSADFDSQVVESLHSISVVRSCGLADEMNFRTETRMVKLLKSMWSASYSGFVVSSSSSLVTQAYSIGLLWIGANLVLKSQLTAGELMSCNALAGYITGPIVAIIGMNASVRMATTATDRLYDILDLEIEKDEGASELNLGEHFGITLTDVNFSYPGRLATLKNISLKLENGNIIALSGKSGCGKSTLLDLLQRHHLPDSGNVLIDGINIQYLTLDSLRSSIAYVPQRIDMLGGTILENLAPNEANPDMPRILELCEQVGILEFIESLPRGFQSVITENGANLSGGQKQRIAIVRALYSDVSIVFMDEPSSALDGDSERMLMDSLVEMRNKGKLVILAVHNRRLLSLCDYVVKMDDGEIVEILDKESVLDSLEDDYYPDTRSPSIDKSSEIPSDTVDPSLTKEARNLYYNLKNQVFGGILLGQDNTNVMGIENEETGWFLAEGRCDFFDVTEKMPAVYGFVIGSLKDGWNTKHAYMVPKIYEAFLKGGVITVSWYPDNIVTGKETFDGCSVQDLLPRASLHHVYKECLDAIATNLGNLKTIQDQYIPILFQFLQQQNGDHFWWGKSRCTKEEYTRLYKFTVTYFRDTYHIHNFLYVFSPGNYSDSFKELMERYPGDDYVDVLSLDVGCGESADEKKKLICLTEGLVQFCEKHEKIPALSHLGFYAENGSRGLKHCSNYSWLRDFVLEPIDKGAITSKIAYLTFAENQCYDAAVYNFPYADSPHANCVQEALIDSTYVMGDSISGIYMEDKSTSLLVEA